MDHWDGRSFGQRNAADYDEQTTRSDTPVTVEALARLADGGPVLDLAIGTGRVALPLAARGLHVEGVEISPEMVAQLRAKPGGAELAVTIGDMADVPVDGQYRLVYVVYNTLFNLVTQDAQVRCFQNVAAHLTGGGRFVIEAFVPSSLVRLRDHEYVMPRRSASMRSASTSGATTRSPSGSTRATCGSPSGASGCTRW